MLHVKLQNHRPSGSKEEDFLVLKKKIFKIFFLFIAMAAILVM